MLYCLFTLALVTIQTHLLTSQLDPIVRYQNQHNASDLVKGTSGGDFHAKQKNCLVAEGADQGFHNYLIYTGILDKYMKVKVFPQGEGPVNTVGGFLGEQLPIQWNMTKWGILRGDAPNMQIHNWNGDVSPVVHQANRLE